MNIAVNTRLLLPGKLEGIGRFTHETLKRITANNPEHRFIFIFDRTYSEEFIYSDNIVPVVTHPQARHPFLWYLFFDWGVPRILKKYKPDLFLSPDGWLSLRSDIPQLPVIHDLNFFHNPEWVEKLPRWYYNKFFPQFIKKAERIATVSEFSKQDIANRFSIKASKIDVVYNGCTKGFVPLNDFEKKAVKEKYSQGDDYLLILGLVHPRKNLARTIQAFSKLKKEKSSNLNLLIVGDIKYMSADVRKALDSSAYKADIKFTGRLSESELKRTMAASLGLVYVSLFEGFGIPILEAMNCDVPVLTSNTSSMPEVGGEAVVYADPFSVDSIASGMQQLLLNKELRNDLVKKARMHKQKFSWDQTANSLWESINKVQIK
jgi:glycosyltransferase involved in cell wall biosynthesis